MKNRVSIWSYTVVAMWQWALSIDMISFHSFPLALGERNRDNNDNILLIYKMVMSLQPFLIVWIKWNLQRFQTTIRMYCLDWIWCHSHSATLSSHGNQRNSWSFDKWNHDLSMITISHQTRLSWTSGIGDSHQDRLTHLAFCEFDGTWGTYQRSHTVNSNYKLRRW
jgi:hypothetical protein